jgi:hypothetical protein
MSELPEVPDFPMKGWSGSIPTPALPRFQRGRIRAAARVAKSLDARDLKSLGRKAVPVGVRPRAPIARQTRKRKSLRSPYSVSRRAGRRLARNLQAARVDT